MNVCMVTCVRFTEQTDQAMAGTNDLELDIILAYKLVGGNGGRRVMQ